MAQRDIENSNKLSELQQKFGVTLVEGGRRFLHEGPLCMIKKNGKLKKGYCYLFNDLLLFTVGKEVRGHISLKNALVSDCQLCTLRSC